jgi:phospholipase C
MNKFLIGILSLMMISLLLQHDDVLSSFSFAFAAASNSTVTSTPITHLVVIFQENISFDHYFATYPNATNPKEQPKFVADPHTPSINGLAPDLLTHNPNSANPFRLDRSEAITCDMNHDYTTEQKAYNGGLLDKFVEFASSTDQECTDPSSKKEVMGYYDGNTVTALWNYARHYAMSDTSFNTVFGPSTPGHLNLVSGQTYGASPSNISDNVANGTVIGDPDPAFDDCGKAPKVSMIGKNVGDLLNEKGITWGWFQGGFRSTGKTADGKAICDSEHRNINGTMVKDYSPHHQPFLYYSSTTNPRHLPPRSIEMIGKTDQANHQYDLSDFWNATQAGNLPAVSFLKAAKYQDGHAGYGYSDPLDEQNFLVNTINNLQKLPQWNSTAVIIAYDDSDGWYDHVMPPIVSRSSDPKYDRLLGEAGLCGNVTSGAYQVRCGYGPRTPLLIISSYSKVNYVDHTITDQSSILRFIEDNWGLGRIGNQSFDVKAGSLLNMFDFARTRDSTRNNSSLFLDPVTGLIVG